MKTILPILLAGLLGLLAYTNPRVESYEQFLNQQLLEKTDGSSNPLVSALGSMLGEFTTGLLMRQTVRKDYLLFSTYDTPFGKEHFRAIGVLNNFYVTEAPEALQEK